MRYKIHLGRIHLGGKYKIGKMIASSNCFDDVRRTAYHLFRAGAIVLVIDTKVGALIGNLWMLTKEIEQ